MNESFLKKLTDNSGIQTEIQIKVKFNRGSSFIGQVPLNGYLAAKSVKFHLLLLFQNILNISNRVSNPGPNYNFDMYIYCY